MFLPISARRWSLTGLAALIFGSLLIGVLAHLPWIHAIDQPLIAGIRQPLTPQWSQAIVSLTLTGNPHPVTTITLVAVISLLILRRWREAGFLVTTVLIEAGLVNSLIKNWVQRPRPDTAPLLHLSSFSFPSGHAMSAVLLWGSLAILIAGYLPHQWRWLPYVAASVWSLLIGLSRVYVGVHYPTDVLAGWSLGFCLLTFTQWLFQRLTKGRAAYA